MSSRWITDTTNPSRPAQPVGSGRFKYPDDVGQICPWLLDSLNSMVRVMQFGGTLPWKYKDTEFEKALDPGGITTEFIRCPDPTNAGVVAKVTQRKLMEPKEVGWA